MKHNNDLVICDFLLSSEVERDIKLYDKDVFVCAINISKRIRYIDSTSSYCTIIQCVGVNKEFIIPIFDLIHDLNIFRYTVVENILYSDKFAKDNMLFDGWVDDSTNYTIRLYKKK